MKNSDLKAQIELLQKRIRESESGEPGDPVDEKMKQLQHELGQLQAQNANLELTWQKTQLARHEKRPYTLDYIRRLFTDFQEIHGDRRYADDPAIICGMACFEGRQVMVIGHQKGRDLKERQYRNFGCANPEGYRKALRVMKMAEKFQRPLITLVDTPGAYPSIGAEERGQAEAIALNIREMASLTIPILVVIIGEGGSGGALGIAVGDRILMMENSFYSVISPEGCSAILWKDQEHMREAAQALKITAEDLLAFGLIDAVIPEPENGAHSDHDAAAEILRTHLRQQLQELQNIDVETRLQDRYRKFRSMGVIESSVPRKNLKA
jgi:acetyl-CoA carboxylase carboxyl transferase subunit alpha